MYNFPPSVLQFSMIKVQLTAILTCLLLLGGCASGPQFDEERFQTATTPASAAQIPENFQGSEIMWGGIIIANNGTDSGSQLEILAYPLSSNQRPDTSKQPVGRFLVAQDSFLEPLDYAAGRRVTVTGTFTGVRDGKVGSADYTFPLVSAGDVHLWSQQDSTPRVNFGVGVTFGF